jgi:hypothetical protein
MAGQKSHWGNYITESKLYRVLTGADTYSATAVEALPVINRMLIDGEPVRYARMGKLIIQVLVPAAVNNYAIEVYACLSGEAYASADPAKWSRFITSAQTVPAMLFLDVPSGYFKVMVTGASTGPISIYESHSN